MIKLRFSLFALLGGLLLVSFSRCQKEDDLSPVRTPEALDTRLQDVYERSNFAGFSVSVIKQGEVAFQKSYGQADVGRGVDLTNQTAMNIASISKLFIGVALMNVVEQGKMTLETEINDVLPFTVTNPHSPEIPIQVKHLITHTSGILDDDDTYFSNYSILAGEDLSSPMAQRMQNELGVKTEGQVLSLNNFVQAYLTPAGPLYQSTNFGKYATGSTYSYSNVGSALAAYIIEIVTGESFDEYTQEVILEPLQMNNTAWKLNQIDRSQVSYQYWDKDNPIPFYTLATYPDGSLVTSIEDLTNFMLEMMKGQSGQSEFLLSKASYQTLFSQKLDTRPPGLPEREENYGVFWVWSTSGRIGHTGGDIGSTAFLGFNPTTQSGSIAIINTNTAEAGNNAAERLAEIVNAYKSFEQAE
ncbi:MAG: serine hydrolase domain-containing protein [Tunicatimonas sp.]|uniref:serine hydrolase domain-containing protein n=1 Tax=Tunicatimonas sp. TaxID=1940096 RepID=UPI003C726559